MIFDLGESDRLFVLLSMAVLSLLRPGLEPQLRRAAKNLGGEELFDTYRLANVDVVKPEKMP
jgi:hypothetical protein